MSAPQSDAFKKAVVDSKKLTSKPSNDDLLELYGAPPPKPPVVFGFVAAVPATIE
jgi:hypothetical protein